MKTFHIKKYPDAAHTGSGILPSAPSRDGLAASLIPMPIMKNKKMMKSSNHHILYIYPALEQRLHLLLDRKGRPSLKIPREEIMTDDIVINHRFERAIPHVIDLF